MTDALMQYLLFVAQTLTVALAVLAVVGGSLALSARNAARAKGRLEVKKLNRRYRDMANALNAATLARRAAKRLAKQDEATAKAARKSGQRKRIFVLGFEGDVRASAVGALREEVTAILTVATSNDEVVVRVTSYGGLVHAYGLAASQLARFKDRGVPLTVAVDKVAASGGYMMACVADRLIAAPFAVLGSIGVVGQVPNFHRLLKKHDVDVEQHTAGTYKRTLTLFGENDERGRRKFKEDLEEAHALFKQFVAQMRPIADVERVSTGETWYGTRALELKLIDELTTSDEYLLAASRAADLFEIRYRTRKSVSEKVGTALETAARGVLGRICGTC